MEGQGQLDKGGAAPLQGRAKALSFQVLRKNGAIDGAEGFCSGKGQGKDAEMPLWKEEECKLIYTKYGKAKITAQCQSALTFKVFF